MKRSDITRELGYIDPEFIAEAASYKPQKISKIRIVALAACIAVLVTAIPLTLILNRENGNTEDLPAITTKDNTVIDNPEPDKEEPLIIFCSSPNELKKQLKADAKVVIKDVAERKELSISLTDPVVDKKASTPYVKTVTIGNETFEVGYNESKAIETYQNLSTHLKAYSSVDKYSTLYRDDRGYEGIVRFEFSRETGKLTNYFKGYNFIKSGDLGEKELQKIALQEIDNLYGIDITQDPNYRYTFGFFPATSRLSERYVLVYTRYINGYATNEEIRISIDTTGQILSLSQNLGLYDEVAELITEENVDSAIDSFHRQFGGWSRFVYGVEIILDNYGKCLVKFYVSIPTSINDSDETSVEIELTK